jgi:hypothetical protein
MQDLVNLRLHVKVIEVEPNRRRLIFSEREGRRNGAPSRRPACSTS